MKFTDLLNEYLEAKRHYDEHTEDLRGEGWYYFERSYTYRRYHEAKDALDSFMESK